MQNQITVGSKIISSNDSSISYIIEYYIVIDELSQNPETNEKEWGIRVNKCNMNKECIETECIKYISPSYDYVFSVAKTLMENDVTPIALYDVLTDIL